MKKIFTLLLLALTAGNMVALPHVAQSTAIHKAQVQSLSPRKTAREEKFIQSAATVERCSRPINGDADEHSIAPAAQLSDGCNVATRAAQATITLNFDKFSYFQYYPSSGDWFVSMSCNDPTKPEYGYVVKFDYFAPADNPWGTFTKEDFDMNYALIGINNETLVFYEDITLTMSQIQQGNMATIIAEATILGSDGNTYHVRCAEQTIRPIATYDLIINNATLNKGDQSFSVTGQNKDLNAKLVINQTKAILGSYDLSMIDLSTSRFVHQGKEISPMQISADVSCQTVSGKLSYVATISLLSTDTVQYNITMNAPLPEPTQTVYITCNNLLVDDSYVDWYGQVFADAYTTEWLVDMAIDGYYLVEGPYSNGITCSIINRITKEEITALQYYLNIARDSNGKWTIKGSVRGSDNVMYQLDLSWTVPTANNVVKIHFDESAEAVYWVQENDLQLSNLTDDYYVSLDVINVAVGQAFGWEQMDHNFSGIIDFHLSYYIEVADAINGMIEQVGDTTKISVSLIGFNEVQYDITLWYAAPTPIETVEDSIAVEFNNLLEDGAFQLHNASSGSPLIVSLTPLTYVLEGTFVNDGMFGRLGAEGGQYDFMDDYTYIATWNGETYDMHSISKGQMTVTVDAEQRITALVDVVCDNAVRYLLTLTASAYTPQPDEAYTPVERTYTVDDVILIDNYADTKGQIYCKLYAADMSDITYLLFFADHSDSDILIPEGSYTIDDSALPGTVYANPGIQDNNIYPSFYAEITSDGYIQLPLWLITSGTVTVSKTHDNQLYFQLDAQNNYNTPIHIIYDGSQSPSAITQPSANSVQTSKILRENQLLIQHNGQYYNVLGMSVE